jgi:hypothetical protein
VKAQITVRDCKNNRDIGNRAVGNQGLGAVQTKPSLGPCGLGGNREYVRARLGLGHGVGRDPGPIAKRGQIFFSLLVAAMLPKRHDACKKVRPNGKYQSAVYTAVTEGFQSHGAGERVKASPAMLNRRRQALELQWSAFSPQVTIEGSAMVALAGALVQLAAGELNDFLAERLLLWAEGKVHQDAPRNA